MAGEDEGKRAEDRARQTEECTTEDTAQERVQKEHDEVRTSKKEQDSQERKWR